MIDMVFQYITGPSFRQRVDAMVEAFSFMQDDLDKERKVIMKQWVKRQEQIERVVGATVVCVETGRRLRGSRCRRLMGWSLLCSKARMETDKQFEAGSEHA